ncbi:MAG: winged helix-turn-helix domain-containing protein [Woeseia sp.]
METGQANRAAEIKGYSFGDCSLSLDTETLARNGRSYRLRAQSFAVLKYLLEQRTHLVTKEELHDAIWGDTCVTDNSLRQCLIEIRKAIGDKSKRMIRTVPRRGFIVDMPVQDIVDRPAQQSFDLLPRSASPDAPRSKAFFLFIAGIAAALLLFALQQDRQTMLPEPSAAATEAASMPRRWGGVEYRPMLVHGLVSEPDVLVATAESSFVAALNNYGVTTFVVETDQTVDSTSDLVLQPTLVAGADLPFVTVIISDGSSDESIWSAQYDANDDDIAALVEQAAMQSAYAVECGLFRRHLTGRNISPELFGMWIRGCVLGVNQKRVEFYELALQIVALAPGDAASHSGLAVALYRMALLNNETPANDDLFARAREEANRALEIEPEFAEALIVLSNALPYGRWQEQEELILRAFKSDAQYKWNRSEYMEFLMRVGRLADAEHFAERNASIAYGPNHQSKLAWLLALNGQVGRAIDVLDRVARNWPEDDVQLDFRLNIQAFMGDPEEALHLLDSDRVIAMLGSTERLECYRRLAQYKANPLRENAAAAKTACARVPGTLYARVLAAIGEVDGAFAEVNAIYDDWSTRGERNASKILFFPEMRALRQDPRFPDLTERSGLASYWSVTGTRPDFCNDPALPYDCKAAMSQAANRDTSSTDKLASAMN